MLGLATAAAVHNLIKYSIFIKVNQKYFKQYSPTKGSYVTK